MSYFVQFEHILGQDKLFQKHIRIKPRRKLFINCFCFEILSDNTMKMEIFYNIQCPLLLQCFVYSESYKRDVMFQDDLKSENKPKI